MTKAATTAERQVRWRSARDGLEQRVEIWLPIETAQSLKQVAHERGLPAKAVATTFIERGLTRLAASRRERNGR